METLNEMEKKASPRVLGFCVSREVIDLESGTVEPLYTLSLVETFIGHFPKSFQLHCLVKLLPGKGSLE